MTHENQDRLIAFATGRLQESDAEELYEHLAICDACSLRLKAISEIRSEFELSWREFGSALAAGAGPAMRGAPAGLERLSVRGMLDGLRQWATLGLEAAVAPTGWQGRFALDHAGTGHPEVDTTVSADLAIAAAACASGDMDRAREALDRVSATAPGAAALPRLQLLLGDVLAGEILIDARRGSLAVLLDPRSVDPSAWSVWLDGEAETTSTGPFHCQPVSGAAYWMAEIDAIPRGAFRVVLVREA